MNTNTKHSKGETTMMIPHDNAKCPRWTGFAASIPGDGHIRHGIPCQDASAVMTSPRPAVIVCDGRGSAKLSHFGAQGAVDAFRFQMSILDPFLVSILDGEEEKPDQWIKFCRIMYRTLMQVKYDLAEKHNEEEKEFDCTVAFAIAGEKHIGCFQVGDGSIVLRQNGVCKTVFLPEKGEYANQTHFLRPGGEEQMKFQYALLDAEVNSGIAITSDGPEHLMFRLSDMTPGKIFDMFLEDLRKEELCRQDLMDYLTRREWADDPRGSDDRSLALLAKIGDVPAVEPQVLDASEPVSETAPVTKEEMPPEIEANPGKKADVSPEAPQECNAETEVQAEVPITPAKAKKKGIPYWTLAAVSGLALGLLAETTCLLKQHQTISRQQAEILCLRQRLAHKKQSEQVLPEPTQPQPKQPDAPAVKGKEPEPAKPQPSQSDTPAVKGKDPEPMPPSPKQPDAPAQGKGSAVAPGTEGKTCPDNSENRVGGNIHKEDIPHEK